MPKIMIFNLLVVGWFLLGAVYGIYDTRLIYWPFGPDAIVFNALSFVALGALFAAIITIAWSFDD